MVIASRNIERLTKAAQSLEHIGEVKPMQCNIRKEDDVKYIPNMFFSKKTKNKSTIIFISLVLGQQLPKFLLTKISGKLTF